jgi:catalase
MQMEVKTSRVNYSPNSLGDNRPAPAPDSEQAFVHYPERLEGAKIRERSPSFSDHFSQATLFWNSLSAIEKDHLVEASHFELGKVSQPEIKQRMLDRFNQVDHDLAKRVAEGLGMPAPTQPVNSNHGQKSEALSQENTTKTAKGRKVAILAAEGVDGAQLVALKQALKEATVEAEVVSKFGGKIKTVEGQEIMVDKTFLTAASVLFDAIYVPGGKASIEALKMTGDALNFINEAFKHCKPIAATAEGVDLLQAADLKGVSLNGSDVQNEQGVIAARKADASQVATIFVEAIAQHRYWNRFQTAKVPA